MPPPLGPEEDDDGPKAAALTESSPEDIGASASASLG